MSAFSTMPFGSLTCPNCRAALPPHALEPGREELCPGCRVALRGQLFRVWWTPAPDQGTNSERALDGEAVCFFHPSNRAALPCDTCGRFLCTICDMPVGSRHLCPVCLSNGLGKEKLPEILSRRFLWSLAALWIGIVPLVAFLVFWPVLFLTGSMTIIVALVGWKRPGSLVRGRQRWAAVIGILLGLVQLGVSVGLISMLTALRSR